MIIIGIWARAHSRMMNILSSAMFVSIPLPSLYPVLENDTNNQHTVSTSSDNNSCAQLMSASSAKFGCFQSIRSHLSTLTHSTDAAIMRIFSNGLRRISCQKTFPRISWSLPRREIVSIPRRLDWYLGMANVVIFLSIIEVIICFYPVFLGSPASHSGCRLRWLQSLQCIPELSFALGRGLEGYP